MVGVFVQNGLAFRVIASRLGCKILPLTITKIFFDSKAESTCLKLRRHPKKKNMVHPIDF